LKNFIILAWLGILEDFLKVPGVSIIWNLRLFIDLLYWVFLLLYYLVWLKIPGVSISKRLEFPSFLQTFRNSMKNCIF
jgi:hypothetical protein